MKTPKTIELIECRKCRGSYFSGSVRVTLMPGNENELPDEIYVIVRKVATCVSCKQHDNRTQGGRRKKFER